MKQILFYDKVNKSLHGGILTDNDDIICGCCGGLIPKDEIGNGEDYDFCIKKVYQQWVELESTIVGDDLDNETI